MVVTKGSQRKRGRQRERKTEKHVSSIQSGRYREKAFILTSAKSKLSSQTGP